MRLNKWFFLAVIVALVLSACGPADTTSIILNVGWLGEPDSLNPALGTLAESYSIYNLIYSTLYIYQSDTNYAFDLAESAEVSDDKLTWTFKIRDNVTFSDGKPLTARDVVFSIRYYASHYNDFPYLPGYTDAFEDVSATERNEVIFQLKHPIPNIEYHLYSLYVLPEHIWASVPVTFENNDMIGSGPFKLSRYEPGREIVLTANAGYYRGQPPVDEIVIKIYADAAALETALRFGEVDLITELPLEFVDALRNTNNVQVVNGPPLAPSLADVIINQVTEENCPEGAICSGHPALRDQVVRQALAYATDKQTIIAQVRRGLAEPGLTLIPTGLGNFYNSAIEDYPFDIEQANTLLEEAGYLDVNKDGIREMPSGTQPLNFRVQWSDSDLDSAGIAQHLQATWQQIGIAVQLEGGTDSDSLAAQCCPAFDYDIILWAWGSDPDPSFLLSVPLTENIGSGFNETGYANAQYDALFEEQAAATDVSARRQLVWEMQQILHNDVVYIIPYYSNVVQAYRTDKFTGWLVNSKTLSLLEPNSIFQLRPLNP